MNAAEHYLESKDRYTHSGLQYDDPFMKKLQAYEDIGLTPEEVNHFFAGYLTGEEAKAKYREDKQRHNEWAEWKKAESEGRLIVPPCKVGDTVYVIIYGEVFAVLVVYIAQYEWEDEFTVGLLIESDKTNGTHRYRFADFGKTVFLTREKAEAALNKR